MVQQHLESEQTRIPSTIDRRKVIICGVPRAGKSTLGRQLAHKLACPYFPCDPLVTAFQERYPESGIYHTNGQYTQEGHVAREFTQFIISYITHGLDKEMASYVVEGFHMDIDLLYQHLGQTHTIIVVAYPHITAEEKYAVIRRLDSKEARTAGVGDAELRRDIAWFLTLSQQYYTCAHWHGIPFIDTSRHHIRTIFAFLADFPGKIEGRVPTGKSIPRLVGKDAARREYISDTLRVHEEGDAQVGVVVGNEFTQGEGERHADTQRQGLSWSHVGKMVLGPIAALSGAAYKLGEDAVYAEA